MRRLARLGAASVAVALAALGLAGCFSPSEPPCAFSCAASEHRCPEHYVCGDDLLCHRQGATDICPLVAPDASADMSGDGAGN